MKLATIEKIENVRKHSNADKLELVDVLGYQCVVPKDTYKEGDLVVFIQPDTVLPELEWAKSYKQYAPKRVKAVKLRGEWSEGIIAPLQIIENPELDISNIGEDVSEELGIIKYEPPQPNDLNAKGGLPFNIPKTDEERWENIKHKLPIGEEVDVTLKIDGQSWSAYYKIDEDKFGICGRTMDYKLDSSNNYIKNAQSYNIEYTLREFCKKHNVSICLRGESYGVGIQALKLNKHSQQPLGLAIFSVYLIDEKRYANKGEQFYFVDVCKELQLPTVPVIQTNVILSQKLIDYFSKDIEKINDNYFEGVVVKHKNGSFKIINKYYDSNK